MPEQHYTYLSASKPWIHRLSRGEVVRLTVRGSTKNNTDIQDDHFPPSLPLKLFFLAYLIGFLFLLFVTVVRAFVYYSSDEKLSNFPHEAQCYPSAAAARTCNTNEDMAHLSETYLYSPSRSQLALPPLP